MKATETLALRLAKRAFVAYTLVAVASCGSGSDGSSSAVVTKSESVQSFVGTVSCDAIGGAPQSRAFETRVIFDRAVYRDMAQEVSGAAAIQVGGLAGSVVKGARSQLTATIPPSSLFAGSVIDFKVAANPATGTYAESGRWAIGVDANGKATLKGDSTATLGPVAGGWRATCRWNLAEAQAPVGPVSYGLIDKRYGTPPTTRPTASAAPSSPVTKGSGGGCGDGWSVVSDGAWVGAAIASVFTGGATIAAAFSISAVASGVAGSTAGNACLDSQLAAMNQQMVVQQAQIQQIDSYLGVATNVLYQKFWQLELQSTTSAASNWLTNINNISPGGSVEGLYASFMNPNGVGLWTYFQAEDPNGYEVNPNAPTDPTQLALNDTAFNQARIQVTARSSDFTTYLKQLSGTDIALPNQSTCGANCSLQVVQAADSALILLYQDLFAALQADIDTYAQPGQTPGIAAPVNQNIVPLYDQYNAMLVKFWTQAVYAMQQALTMEWMVNQMNYFRGTSTTATQLPQIGSWGAIAGTHYQYGNQSLEVETTRYNTAQQNLAKLYAARINQLYLNTLNYVISDVPVAPQAYPTAPLSFTFNGVKYTEKPVDYSGQMGKAIPASTNGAQGPTPLSLLPKAALTNADSTPANWMSGAVLYQFSGLNDVAACMSNLQAYTASTPGGTVQGWLQTPGACPSIFTLADGSPLSYTCDTASPPNCKGSIYDGNTLQPYTTFQSTGTTGGPIALTTKIANNLKFCDPVAPALAWDPRGPMLNCGKWYVPQYLAKGFPRANVPMANSDSGFYGSAYYASASISNAGVKGCSNNLSFEGARYPLLTTLTGSWPSGSPSSCTAVIPSVALVGTSSLQSPVFTNTRQINGNFYTGDQTQGCTIGYIGFAPNNALSFITDNRIWVQLDLRLPRAMDPGNESGGFALPLQVSAGCQVGSNTSDQYAQMDVAVNSFYGGDINVAGYQCTGQNNIPPAPPSMNCTIADGTRYTISAIQGGQGYYLDVRVTP